MDPEEWAQTALVVGESLVDVVSEPGASTGRERPGGSAANAAVALARLGRAVTFATSYGDDERGQLITEHLAGSGVSLATDPLVVPRTSVAHARIGADGAAEYDFDVAWRLGTVEAEEPHVVHVCSLAPVLEPGSDAALALVDRCGPGTTTTYDVNVRPAITGCGPAVVERVERMVGRADLVKASDEDLAALWPDLEVDDAAVHLLHLGSVAVVVTRGAAGSSWHTRAGSGEVGAPQVAVVDTIGAGDVFGAGLVDALWEHLGPDGRERLAALPADDWTAALDHAARCAAVVVGREGADPPWRSDLAGA